MNSITELFSKDAPVVLFALTLAVTGLIIALFVLAANLKKTTSRFRSLLAIPSEHDLESLLVDHTRERVILQEQIRSLEGRIEALEVKMNKAKRHLGLVKYDAFDDVGGQQSFALAIYDDRGDGTIVSSIIGRADCRVYAKTILGGKSDRTLSSEEQQAILAAATSAPKGLVSQ